MQIGLIGYLQMGLCVHVIMTDWLDIGSYPNRSNTRCLPSYLRRTSASVNCTTEEQSLREDALRHKTGLCLSFIHHIKIKKIKMFAVSPILQRQHCGCLGKKEQKNTRSHFSRMTTAHFLYELYTNFHILFHIVLHNVGHMILIKLISDSNWWAYRSGNQVAKSKIKNITSFRNSMHFK